MSWAAIRKSSRSVSRLSACRLLVAVVPPVRRRVGRLGQVLAVAQGEVGRSGQERHEIGVLGEQAPQRLARPQKQAQAPRDLRRLAEGGGQGGRPLRARGEVPQPQQTHVRVGRLRQPLQQQREHLLHEARRTGEPAGQLDHRLPRVRSTSVKPKAASRAAAASGVSTLDPAVENASSSGRNQIRSWMARTVDWCRPEVGLELVDDRGQRRAAVAEHPGQPIACLLRSRDGVHLLLVHQLEPVLDGAQEPVGQAQLIGVGPPDVPRVGQFRQGHERRRRSQRRVEWAVDELKQLHRELDVADATPAALHLPVGEAPLGDLALGPDLHGADRAQILGRESAVPQPLGRRPLEGRAEFGIAGDGSGLQQSLELPRLGPPVPVGLERFDRADEGAVAALGSQVEVDPETAAGEGGRRPGSLDRSRIRRRPRRRRWRS